MLKKIKTNLRYNSGIIILRLFKEILLEYSTIIKHLGEVSKKKKKEKWEADILIRFHAIEKGLSLKNPRIGFGEEKVQILLINILEITQKYGYIENLAKYKSILDAYFNFNKQNGHQNEKLYNFFIDVYSKIPNKLPFDGGSKVVWKKDILENVNFNFEDFFNNRYSIRNFSTESIPFELIQKCFKIAEKTPSACNRQSWRIYVVRDKKKKKQILEWQGGNRGFSDEIDTVIVVCSDINMYFINERHQPYVDGALYGMSLILAFHSKGLGTIPLTLGMLNNKMNLLHSYLDIPKNHIPILMIGVGQLEESFEVACSSRIPSTDYVQIL